MNKDAIWFLHNFKSEKLLLGIRIFYIGVLITKMYTHIGSAAIRTCYIKTRTKTNTKNKDMHEQNKLKQELQQMESNLDL